MAWDNGYLTTKLNISQMRKNRETGRERRERKIVRRRPSGLLAFKSKSYRTTHMMLICYTDHCASSSGLRVSVSNMGGANQWRKESVTIIESQEPMEEDTEENEGDVESDGADKEPVAQTRSDRGIKS